MVTEPNRQQPSLSSGFHIHTRTHTHPCKHMHTHNIFFLKSQIDTKHNAWVILKKDEAWRSKLLKQVTKGNSVHDKSFCLGKFPFHIHICSNASGVYRKYSACCMASLESNYTKCPIRNAGHKKPVIPNMMQAPKFSLIHVFFRFDLSKPCGFYSTSHYL